MLETSSQHTLSELFSQLGLPNDDEDIAQFIEQHSPLPKTVLLAQADWWNEAQKSFLDEALADDAEWAIVVDELNILLR